MRLKSIPLWEQYIEKLVLGILLICLLVVIVFQVIGAPNVQDVRRVGGGSTSLSPGELNAALIADAATVRVLVVTWLPSVLSWQQFRDVVIGPTDPSTASPKSLRGKFRTHWHSLGLAREPAISCNCVHASAGPLEGLKEREVWAGASVADDPLGRRLVAKLSNPFTQPPRDGAAVLRSWLDTNPVYQLGAGDAKKIFDATEGMDARELLDALPNPPGRVAA